MRPAIRSLILVVLAATVLTAQAEPDFSGRWVLVSASQPGPDVPRALSVRQVLVRTTVYGEPMKPFFRDIAIDRDYESGTRSETHNIGVKGGVMGGIVPGIARDGRPTGPRGLYAVIWDQNALVFDNASYTGDSRGTGEWSERREVWSLQPDGRLQVAITTAGSNARSTTVTLVYRRL